MKKIFRRITSLALAMAIAIPSTITTFGASGDGVHGGASVGDTVNVFTKDTINWMSYGTNNGKPFFSKSDAVNFVSHLGTEYESSAYCIDPTKEGVSSVGNYDVVLSEFDDDKLNGIIYKGYPHVSPEELGLNNSAEAYYATKMAIDTHLNGLDINKWTPTAGQTNATAVVNAIKKVYNDGINFDIKSLPKSEFVVEKVGENLNGDEITMKVTTNATKYSDISLSLSGADKPADAKITDMSGNPKSTFKVDEEFKVVFTLPEGEYSDKTFNIDVDGTIQDYSKVLKGTPANTVYQRYAVIPQWTNSKTNGKVTYKNTTEPNIDPPTGGSSKLKIVKLDKGTRKGLAGAIFEVRHINNDILGTFTSDANGEINLDVEDGNYIIQEIVPPKGFVLSNQTKQEIIVKSDDEVDSVVTFENEKKPSLTVKKVDGKTGLPLANATIRIALDGGSDFVDVVTDSSGTAVLQDLIEGTYTATEIVAPSGFLLNSEKHSIKLQNGKDSTITIDNFKTPTIIVNKFDEGSGEVLPNAEFSIAEKGGSIVNEGMTDENGKFTTTDLKGGIWYTITELQAPTHYFGTTISKDVYLEKGQTLNVKFDNRMKPSLLIKKISSETGLPLAGATFKVTSTEGKTIGEFTTNEKGEILIEYLDEGIYSVEEIISPIGHVLNPQHKDVKLEWANKVGSNVTELVFENKVKPSIEVTKIDGLTNEPLENATIRVALNGSTEYVELTTDSNGKAIFTDLEDGTYIVSEQIPPSGFLLNKTEYVVKVVDGKATPITIPNYKEPTLIVVKYDEATGETLPLTEFSLAEKGGVVVNEGMTDENGMFITTGLSEGWYSLTELAPPANYFMTTPTRDVYLKNGETLTVKVDNRLKPSLLIKKIDSITKEPIEGVTFKITSTESSTVTEKITDANGEILLPYLGEGIFTVEEIKTLKNYILDSTPKTIKLEWNNTIPVVPKELIFENTQKPTLIINKINGLTNKGIPNATFKIEKENTNGSLTQLGTYKTDSNGQIIIPFVDEGWYIATETIPAQGFNLPSNPVTRIYLSKGENSYQTTTGVEQVEDGTSANGATDAIKTSSTPVVTSGNDYLGQDVINYPLNSIIIKKTNAITGELLEGAVFELIQTTNSISGSQGTVIGRYTTDNSGVIVVTGLEAGGYIAKEVKAPENYLISENSSQQVWLKADGTSIEEITFANYPYGRLLITKLDGITNEKLSGAVFKVTDSTGAVVGNSNGEFTTNSNGEILIPNLKPDSYVITEQKAPQNYQIVNTPKTVQIGTDGKTYKVEFENMPYGSLIINKLDKATKEPISDTQFKVTDSTGAVVGNSNGIYTTNALGVIEIPNLPKGTFIVKEIVANKNYILESDAKTIQIEYGQTHTLDFYNTKKSGMQIIKIDSETKEPLKDAHFTIYKKNGEEIGSYVTDGNGLIIIDNLDNGWYKAVETKSPSGYILDETPKDFEVTGNQFIKLVFENKKMTSLIIKKIDEFSGVPLKGATFVVERQNGELVGEYTTDSDGLINIPQLKPDFYIVREKFAPSGYLLQETPKTVEVKTNVPTVVTFTNRPLSGLKILKLNEVTREPIEGVTFRVSHMNGEKVMNDFNALDFKTDKQGTILIPNLEDGYYTVQEIKEASGFLIDSEPKTVLVAKGKMTVLEVTNKPISTLIINKTNSENGEVLEGVEFLITKLNGEEIAKKKTDKGGQIILQGLQSGTYIVRETKQLEGFKLDETPHEVEIRDGKRTTLDVTNTPLSSILIHKIDSVTKEGIYGVKFLLYDAKDNPIGQFISDDKGYVHINKELPQGKYKLMELEPKEGYMLDLKKIKHRQTYM